MCKMSVNKYYGALSLIVITLNWQSVTFVEGNCMQGMNKINPMKKAAEKSFKEICSKCDLKMVPAEIDRVMEKGFGPVLDKVASHLECKEKDDLVKGLKEIFKECSKFLKEGVSMCSKDPLKEFNECAEKKAKEKKLMNQGMNCCNNPGFTKIFAMIDCAIIEIVAGLKGKGFITASADDWKKLGLKCDPKEPGYEPLVEEMMGYMKNCG